MRARRRRRVPLQERRFLYWLGYEQPGWRGGVLTGLVITTIIFVLCFLFWYWLGV